MKSVTPRKIASVFFLASFAFLSACCGMCKKCPEDAECTVIPSNAATGIKSSAGGRDGSAPGAALPEGWRVSYPLFEGDYFSATLPPGAEDDPEAVVKTIVTHMGFSDPTGGDVITGEFLARLPPEITVGGGDILKVAQINCEVRPPTGRTRYPRFCKLNESQQKQLIQRATGMEASDYLNRTLKRRIFLQRPRHRSWPTSTRSSERLCVPDSESSDGCRDVFIEHSLMAVTTRNDRGATVASVSGRVFPRYRITNEPDLTAAQARASAYRHLGQIKGISELSNPPDSEREPPLVLLPYGYATRFDFGRLGSFQWPGYRTPQLRYAYRMTLYGKLDDEAGREMEVAGWRAWVDAKTGDILQLVPQFAFADSVQAEGEGWRRSPSYPVSTTCPDPASDDCPTAREFQVDEVDAGTEYCLKLTDVFDQLEYYDSQGTLPFLCSATHNFAADLDCSDPWECLCDKNNLKAVSYLHMNAYAHVSAYMEKLNAAICSPPSSASVCDGGKFRAAWDEASGAFVPLRIKISASLSSGSFVQPHPQPHLTFGEIGGLFANSALCASTAPLTGTHFRPAAQDATLMTHEFAHIIMDGLHAGRPDNWCGLPVCPVPLNADIVHDMADGLSVTHNQTDWFGKWWGNGDVANHSEADGYIRHFNYATDFDHFPEHRDWSKWFPDPDLVSFRKKEYADGQIAAAALWAVTEKMNGWIEYLGPASFETTLLNVLPDHFIPNACAAFEQGGTCDYPDDCDLDVYRYLHSLLGDLVANNLATGVTAANNKILSGFARTGIFLVPPRCIQGNTGAPPADVMDAYCPTGHYGGDAIIDITDDWLQHGAGGTPAQIPEFEVWTGPQFRFQGGHAVVMQPTDPPPCNRFYKITIANNPEFKHVEAEHKLSRDTVWLDSGGYCQAQWSPPANGEWKAFWEDITQLSRDKGISEVYYRVVTGESAAPDAGALSSSEYPGRPLFNALDPPVDPPFAILNDTGELTP